MDNGIVKVNLSKPEGFVIGIQYNGLDNLLEVLNPEFDRGYNNSISNVTSFFFCFFLIITFLVLLVDQLISNEIVGIGILYGTKVEKIEQKKVQRERVNSTGMYL
jgi:hypothetical protein